LCISSVDISWETAIRQAGTEASWKAAPAVLSGPGVFAIKRAATRVTIAVVIETCAPVAVTEIRFVITGAVLTHTFRAVSGRQGWRGGDYIGTEEKCAYEQS
jgi:hypothetical protein